MMVTDWIYRINSAIKYSFYLLFFITPLAMWPDTYELFEFNKMWIVFGFAVFIFFLWAAKSIIRGKIEIRRTPLDIPIALFLISQIISTIISIDPHVSLWGYYSRFNGGLFSTIAYIFLYYAFATNLTGRHSVNGNDARPVPQWYRARIGNRSRQTSPNNETGFLTDQRNPISYSLLTISLLSGFVVTLWGLPSHFGYDLTCLVFRGELNTACWTEAFQPTVRIFSTLGQPNWLGTYLAALIPIALGFGIYKLKENRATLFPIIYLLVSSIYFLALLWTRSQSSFVGLGIGLLVFFGILIANNIRELKQKFAKNNLAKYLALSILIFTIITFLIGSPIESLNKFTTLSGFSNLLNKPTANSQELKAKDEGLASTTNIQLGGTESSKIRLIVWQGAIELFKRNPLFGTGVETYAYAYYNVKPLAHNLTSEWDYLYNKAHNEYLNYLATTGAFGLITYLSILAFFLYYAVKKVLKDKEYHSSILLGIIGAYLAISVSNFFGFSVVVLNLFLFMLPIFFFDLGEEKTLSSLRTISILKEGENKITPGRASIIVAIALVTLYFEFYLLNFWSADRKYALGYNLNKAGEYAQAFTLLSDSTKMLPSEDLYKDELSINMATLAILLEDQKQATTAAQFVSGAKQLSDQITSRHPNNVIFLKTRARVAYALAQIDPRYLDLAIETVDKTRELAPTDAKLVYNLALFYNQKGDAQKTIKYFEEALKLKPNYLDVYYALGLFYSSLAKDDPSSANVYKQKAREAAEYILKNIDPAHEPSKELLKSL
ncbi:MAG: O-antigen ligase family protein [Candidatus Levybacteria bacterium]|nr:O-antigen ligase family protein [Candidatus Levybacteria bacterium]